MQKYGFKKKHSKIYFLCKCLSIVGGPLHEYYSLFFKEITVQLLSGIEGRASISEKHGIDGTLLFVGEIFSRICRRGSSGN